MLRAAKCGRGDVVRVGGGAGTTNDWLHVCLISRPTSFVHNIVAQSKDGPSTLLK